MIKANKKVVVEMKPLQKTSMTVRIKGLTPLLMEKMDMRVVERYDKKKSGKIAEKDTESEEDKVEAKIWYTEEGNVGFPASAFMKGMVEVAPYLDMYKKTVLSGVRVNGGIIPIEFKKQKLNTTYGRTSGISKSPRKIIRPEFTDWSCTLNIVYDASILSAEQVINLINRAGFHMGLGGYRPQCSGSYGQYEVQK